MLAEIINPSDAVCIEHADPLVLAVAILILGEGHYGAEAEEGDIDCPIFLFGGFEAWWAKKEIGTFGDYIGTHGTDIAAALDTVTYGHFRDYREAQDAIAKMSPEDGAAWMAKRNDARRSSMNNIGARAALLAKRFRATVKEQA